MFVVHALAGCCKSNRKGIDTAIPSYYDPPTEGGHRRVAGRDVQLRVAGRAGPGRPSAASDSADHRPGIGAAVAPVWGAVREFRAPVGAARAAAAGAAAASALYDSQRATADGAARLQPAV